MREAAALAGDIAMKVGDLVGGNLAHGSKLDLFGLAEIGLGALGGLAANTESGQYRQGAVVAIELDEAVLVELAQITNIVKIVTGITRGALIELLQIFD